MTDAGQAFGRRIGTIAKLLEHLPPKGHHRHRGHAEDPYPLTTVGLLLRDFLADIRRAKAERLPKEESR